MKNILMKDILLNKIKYETFFIIFSLYMQMVNKYYQKDKKSSRKIRIISKSF